MGQDRERGFGAGQIGGHASSSKKSFSTPLSQLGGGGVIAVGFSRKLGFKNKGREVIAEIGGKCADVREEIAARSGRRIILHITRQLSSTADAHVRPHPARNQ